MNGKSTQEAQSYMDMHALIDNVMILDDPYYSGRFSGGIQRTKLLKLFSENQETVLFFPDGNTNLQDVYAHELIVSFLTDDLEKVENYKDKKLIVECSNMHYNAIERAFVLEVGYIMNLRREERKTKAHELYVTSEYFRKEYKSTENIERKLLQNDLMNLEGKKNFVTFIPHGIYHSCVLT